MQQASRHQRQRAYLAIKKEARLDTKYTISEESVTKIKVAINQHGEDNKNKLLLIPSSRNEAVYALGGLVWGRLHLGPWWPGYLVNGEDVGLVKKVRPNQLWIFWLGDNRISQVSPTQLTSFAVGFSMFYDFKSKQPTYKNGVLEALKIYRSRMETPQEELEGSHLLGWAISYFTNKENLRKPPITNNVPVMVKERLFLMKLAYGWSKAIEMDLASFWHLARAESLRDLSSNCIACKLPNATLVSEHPLFHGRLCEKCLLLVKKNFFELNTCCAVCAKPRKMKVSCHGPDCQRVFCEACIISLAAPYALSVIKSEPNWQCFMCSEQPKLTRLLKKQENWELNVIRMYKTKASAGSLPLTIQDKPEIRVLSLFDGIGTGIYVLSTLNLKINEYFSSEINELATSVTKVNFPDQVTYIGDVENINEESLREILPIDLLIGGLSGDDLSMVNPQMKGIHDPNGSGVLVSQYVRVLNLLKPLMSEDRPLFWLFQNSCALPAGTRYTINEFLDGQPSLVDSNHLCTIHRSRYFWGNIPGLEMAGNDLNTNFSTALNSHFTPDCGAIRTVPKLRTMTFNEDFPQPGPSHGEHIMTSKQPDLPWINQIETAFGFPRQYTAIRDLTDDQRHDLLKKATSVPMIQKVLHPLRSFFKEC